MKTRTLKLVSEICEIGYYFNDSFACAEGAAIIGGWNYFSTLVTTQDLDHSSADLDWRSLHPGNILSECLGVFRLLGHLALDFATVIVWSHKNTHEALLYSPHGIKTKEPSLQTFLHSSSPISILAILHALHDSTLIRHPNLPPFNAETSLS